MAHHVELKTESLIGPEQTITIYERPLEPSQVHAAVIGSAENLVEDDEGRFREHIFIPNWREALLVLEPGAQTDPARLTMRVASSFHIQAIRKGMEPDVLPVSVLGVLVTSDGKVVLGARRGRMAGGQAHVTPAGYAAYRHRDNPVFDAFYEELGEEVGLAQDEITSCSLIAMESEPNTKGIAFIVLAHTRADSATLQRIHHEAFEPYRRALDAGTEELEARKEIAGAGHRNVDAWEHSGLILLDDDVGAIEQAIERRSVEHEGSQVQLVDACRGALMAYAYLLRQADPLRERG